MLKEPLSRLTNREEQTRERSARAGTERGDLDEESLLATYPTGMIEESRWAIAAPGEVTGRLSRAVKAVYAVSWPGSSRAGK